MQQQNKFGPAPYGPEEGSKGETSLTSITKSNSKIYTPNFLYSYKLDMKYIEWDFCSEALVMPQEWDLGVPGVPRGQNFLF